MIHRGVLVSNQNGRKYPPAIISTRFRVNARAKMPKTLLEKMLNGAACGNLPGLSVV